MKEGNGPRLAAQGRAKHQGRRADGTRYRTIDDKNISSFDGTARERAACTSFESIRSDPRETGPVDLRRGTRTVDQADEPLSFPLGDPREHRQGSIQRQGIAFHGCRVGRELVVVQDAGSSAGVVRRKEVVRHEHSTVRRRNPGPASVSYLVEPNGRAQGLPLGVQQPAQALQELEVGAPRSRGPVAVDLQLVPGAAARFPQTGDPCNKGACGIHRLEAFPQQRVIDHVHDRNDLARSAVSPRLPLCFGEGQRRCGDAHRIDIEHPHIKTVDAQRVSHRDLRARGPLGGFPVVQRAVSRRRA